MFALARNLLPLALAAGLWSCAAGSRRVTSEHDLISREEVVAAEVTNAYQLVERLRPLWLRSRGERSTRLETVILVYQNQSMLGDIEQLRAIPIEIVHSIRVLNAAEAGRLAGLGSQHVERVIMVTTLPRGS
jgi:hypothetical protein